MVLDTDTYWNKANLWARNGCYQSGSLLAGGISSELSAQ
jgi:hypothetical protein